MLGWRSAQLRVLCLISDFQCGEKPFCGAEWGERKLRINKVGLRTQPLLHAIRIKSLGLGDHHFVALLKPNLGQQTREDSSTTISSLRVPFISATVNSPSTPAMLSLALSSSSSTPLYQVQPQILSRWIWLLPTHTRDNIRARAAGDK